MKLTLGQSIKVSDADSFHPGKIGNLRMFIGQGTATLAVLRHKVGDMETLFWVNAQSLENIPKISKKL